MAATHAARHRLSHRSVREPRRRPGVVRVDGAGRVQESFRGHRDAVGRGAGGMSQAPEPESRPRGRRANVATRRAGVLGLRAVFIHTLPSSFKSSFVMTDEMGNILGSSFLSQQENTFAVTLPAPVQLAATTPAGI